MTIVAWQTDRFLSLLGLPEEARLSGIKMSLDGAYVEARVESASTHIKVSRDMVVAIPVMESVT